MHLPRPIAFVLAVLNFATLPVHSFVSCSVSATLGGVSFVSSLITAMLCFMTPRATPDRFRPLVLATIAFILNSLFVH